jgi:hypothetical protein
MKFGAQRPFLPARTGTSPPMESGSSQRQSLKRKPAPTPRPRYYHHNMGSNGGMSPHMGYGPSQTGGQSWVGQMGGQRSDGGQMGQMGDRCTASQHDGTFS